MSAAKRSGPSGSLRQSLTRRQLLKGLGLTAVGVAVSGRAVPAFAAAGGDTIKIGAIYPLTGGMALLGEESWRGAEVARVLQNKKGGVLGKQIEFVRGDAPDANAAVSQANRLISSQRLQILIGTYSSPLAFAASEVAERNQVIYWEMGGISDPIVERGFKYLFRITPMGSNYGGKAAEYSKEVLAPKFGIAPDKLKISIEGKPTPFAELTAELKSYREKAEAQVKEFGTMSTELKTKIENLQSQVDAIDVKLAEKAAAWFELGPAFEWSWKILQWPVVFALISLAIAIVYYYAPDAAEPGKPAKKDFVGWSGIGPIMYLLEYGVPYADETKVASLSVTQAVSDALLLIAEGSRSISDGRFRNDGSVANTTGIDAFSDLKVVENIYAAGVDAQLSKMVKGELRYQARRYDDKIDNTQDGRVDIALAALHVRW